MGKKTRDMKPIKLAQPDRSGPTDQTLLDFAEKAGILDQAQQKNDATPAAEEPLVGRLAESILWSTSLAMLHFTLDVFVMNQYASELEWDSLVWKAAQAFPVILLFFYALHPHPSPSPILPLASRVPPLLHQLFFFISSISAGCYLIHITNEYSSYAVMKQSPPLGCLWIWSVIELDVFWATGSLVICGAFLKLGGYSVF